MTWEAIYASETQALWALWVVPLLFLGFRAATRERTPAGSIAAFVAAYGLLFTFETLADPFVVTFVGRRLGWPGTAAGTAAGLLFVLLGDLRVFLLVFGVRAMARAKPWSTAWTVALALTAVVPVLAYAVFGAGQRATAGGLPGRWLWLFHETIFAVTAIALSLWIARDAAIASSLRAFLRAVLHYSAVYYLLWAGADVLILAGWDAGFALRIVPNQLYYAFFIPYVWWRFQRVADAEAGRRP